MLDDIIYSLCMFLDGQIKTLCLIPQLCDIILHIFAYMLHTTLKPEFQMMQI
jgi:hypothetical protein